MCEIVLKKLHYELYWLKVQKNSLKQIGVYINLIGEDVYLPMDEDIPTSNRRRHNTVYLIFLHLAFLVHDLQLKTPSSSACVTTIKSNV